MGLKAALPFKVSKDEQIVLWIFDAEMLISSCIKPHYKYLLGV
jgi:hypothetical protein